MVLACSQEFGDRNHGISSPSKNVDLILSFTMFGETISKDESYMSYQDSLIIQNEMKYFQLKYRLLQFISITITQSFTNLIISFTFRKVIFYLKFILNTMSSTWNTCTCKSVQQQTTHHRCLKYVPKTLINLFYRHKIN